MRLLNYHMILLLLLTGCERLSHKNSDEALTIYTDSGSSSIQIIKNDSIKGILYQTIETRYQIIYLTPQKNVHENFLAKYIIERKTSTGSELQNTNYEIELKPLTKSYGKNILIKQNCDDIMLEPSNYYAVKHGCCGTPDIIRIYDYNNKLIVEGEDRIITATIPNTHIEMNTGFINKYGNGGVFGIVCIGFAGDDRYEIKLISHTKKTENCTPGIPHIVVFTGSPRDGYISESNKYDLWSLEKIRTINQLNNVSVKLNFECDTNIETIEIPIIKGKPFGKCERNQEIEMRYKTINRKYSKLNSNHN